MEATSRQHVHIWNKNDLAGLSLPCKVILIKGFESGQIELSFLRGKKATHMAHLLTKKKKKSVTSLCIKSFKGTVTQKKWFRPLKVLKSVIEMKSYMLGIIFQQFKYSCFFSGHCSLPTACLWSSQVQGSRLSRFSVLWQTLHLC